MFNNQTSLRSDACEVENRTGFNKSVADYIVNHDVYNIDSDRDLYMKTMTEQGLYQASKRDGAGHFIRADSALRNGEKGNISTNNREINQLCVRTFSTPRHKQGTSIIDPDTHSKLIFGKSTSKKRSENCISQDSFDTFIPLVPQMKRYLEAAPVHKHCIRGGISTRNIIKNVDYKRKHNL